MYTLWDILVSSPWQFLPPSMITPIQVEILQKSLIALSTLSSSSVGVYYDRWASGATWRKIEASRHTFIIFIDPAPLTCMLLKVSKQIMTTPNKSGWYHPFFHPLCIDIAPSAIGRNLPSCYSVARDHLQFAPSSLPTGTSWKLLQLSHLYCKVKIDRTGLHLEW